MLRLIALLGLVIGAAAGSAEPVFDREYLYHGDKQIPRWYDSAVRHVLGRAWRKDVVLRLIAFHPFDRETVIGILCSQAGYSGFVIRPSQQIYNAPGNLGSTYLAHLRSTMQQRSLDGRVAAEMIKLWQTVLENPRYYGMRKEPSPDRDGSRTIILDMTHFSYFVRTSFGVEITASMDGWGPQTDTLIQVGEALQSFVGRKTNDTELIRAIVHAQKQVASNQSMRRTAAGLVFDAQSR